MKRLIVPLLLGASIITLLGGCSEELAQDRLLILDCVQEMSYQAAVRDGVRIQVQDGYLGYEVQHLNGVAQVEAITNPWPASREDPRPYRMRCYRANFANGIYRTHVERWQDNDEGRPRWVSMQPEYPEEPKVVSQ